MKIHLYTNLRCLIRSPNRKTFSSSLDLSCSCSTFPRPRRPPTALECQRCGQTRRVQSPANQGVPGNPALWCLSYETGYQVETDPDLHRTHYMRRIQRWIYIIAKEDTAATHVPVKSKINSWVTFRVKSSRVPDITDSDLLEILHSCNVPWNKFLSTFIFSVKWSWKYGSSKSDRIGAIQFEIIPISAPMAHKKMILILFKSYLKVLFGHPIETI